MNDRLVSLSHSTHSSSLNTQLLLSPVHPSVSESSTSSGLLNKTVFDSFDYSILVTEHLVVLVHDIFDRGFVLVCVDHYRYHDNEGVWVNINFWKLSQSTRENTCSTLSSSVRWDTFFLKTKNWKENRIRNYHIISNLLSTRVSILTNHWHSSDETLDHLWISSVTTSNSTVSVISDSDSSTCNTKHPTYSWQFVLLLLVRRHLTCWKLHNIICLTPDVCLVQRFLGLLKKRKHHWSDVRLFGPLYRHPFAPWQHFLNRQNSFQKKKTDGLKKTKKLKFYFKFDEYCAPVVLTINS